MSSRYLFKLILIPQDKRVTIVHGDSILLNKTCPDKFRNAITKSLELHGVQVACNDFIDDFPADGVVGVTTRNGQMLDADLVVCIIT